MTERNDAEWTEALVRARKEQIERARQQATTTATAKGWEEWAEQAAAKLNAQADAADDDSTTVEPEPE